MGIDEIKKELEKEGDKVSYLKRVLQEEKHSSFVSEIRKLYIDEIKKKGLVRLSSNEDAVYEIVYDSMSEGIEPIYFWVLDFLSNDEPTGLGYDVKKTDEAFEASAASSYFGDIGSRQSVMQDRAMRMLQLVNTIIRSIINLIYDLKEFDIRLAHYDDLKSDDKDKREAAELAIKSMWMDQVDIKKGRGAINLMVQQLGFATLRDAFMFINPDPSEIDMGAVEKLDLNKRVKGILKRKYEEYAHWKDFSQKELSKRRNIEKAYLKSQVESLKLYTKWAKPYLRAAQKLGFRDLGSPHIVAAFNNMEMELSIFGKREVKPVAVFEHYTKLKLDKKYYACIEVDFHFRSVPQSLRGAGATQYIHTGTTKIVFRAYAFSADEIEEIEKQELYEDMDIVENLTDVSLKELQEELDSYLKDKSEEEKKAKEAERLKKRNKRKEILKSPFGRLPEGFRDMMDPIVKGVKNFNVFSATSSKKYVGALVLDRARDTALRHILVMYDVYKKAHGMVTW